MIIAICDFWTESNMENQVTRWREPEEPMRASYVECPQCGKIGSQRPHDTDCRKRKLRHIHVETTQFGKCNYDTWCKKMVRKFLKAGAKVYLKHKMRGRKRLISIWQYWKFFSVFCWHFNIECVYLHSMQGCCIYRLIRQERKQIMRCSCNARNKAYSPAARDCRRWGFCFDLWVTARKLGNIQGNGQVHLFDLLARAR